MVNNSKALWDNCLSLIKANVAEQQYKAWFEPIVFEHYDEATRTLLLQVPSRYFYEYLEQYYVPLLSKVLNSQQPSLLCQQPRHLSLRSRHLTSLLARSQQRRNFGRYRSNILVQGRRKMSRLLKMLMKRGVARQYLSIRRTWRRRGLRSYHRCHQRVSRWQDA